MEEFTPYLIAVPIWVVLSIVVGAVAKSRGLPAGIWTALAFVLSPIIAVILVSMTPRNQRGIEGQAVAAGDSRKCPQCAEIIRAEARLCRFCQSPVVPLK